jgi:hypothetical protein
MNNISIPDGLNVSCYAGQGQIKKNRASFNLIQPRKQREL